VCLLRELFAREAEVLCLVNKRVLFVEFAPVCWCCVLFSSKLELHTISLCVIAPICVLQEVMCSRFFADIDVYSAGC
jgi:hypothetical protein